MGEPFPTLTEEGQRSLGSIGLLIFLRQGPATHDGFRFRIRFDRDKMGQNEKAVWSEVDKLPIFSRD